MFRDGEGLIIAGHRNSYFHNPGAVGYRIEEDGKCGYYTRLDTDDETGEILWSGGGWADRYRVFDSEAEADNWADTLNQIVDTPYVQVLDSLLEVETFEELQAIAKIMLTLWEECDSMRQAVENAVRVHVSRAVHDIPGVEFDRDGEPCLER